jgi:hypothetical protein
MSVAVGIDKCIRNGHIETVTCTCTGDGFVAVRINHFGHICFIYERDVKIAFFYKARTWKTREYSDGIKDKLQK